LVARFHIDTDFLVYALATSGPERMRLRALAATDAVLEISAMIVRAPLAAFSVAISSVAVDRF
jgi:hypothetical protein